MAPPGVTHQQPACLSCGTPLQGSYCHACGEKVIHPGHDYSVKEFAEETVDGFTHFDSKIIRSFKYLLLRPGRLTKDFLEGRRVRLMKPVQLFIVTSVVFYLFMSNSLSFYASYGQLTAGYSNAGFSLDNPVKYNINAHLKRKALKELGSGADKETINKTAGAIYEKAWQKAPGKSKTFLFLMVPFLALAVYGLFFRRNGYYVPHLIFALHVFSFFLLADLLFLVFYFDILKLRVVHNTTHLLPFFILLLVYIVTAVRTVYHQKWLHAAWKGFLIFATLLALLVLYRVFIMWWSVYSV